MTKFISGQVGDQHVRKGDHFTMYADPTPWYGYTLENGLQVSHLDSFKVATPTQGRQGEFNWRTTYMNQRDL